MFFRFRVFFVSFFKACQWDHWRPEPFLFNFRLISDCRLIKYAFNWSFWTKSIIYLTNLGMGQSGIAFLFFSTSYLLYKSRVLDLGLLKTILLIVLLFATVFSSVFTSLAILSIFLSLAKAHVLMRLFFFCIFLLH